MIYKAYKCAKSRDRIMSDVKCIYNRSCTRIRARATVYLYVRKSFGSEYLILIKHLIFFIISSLLIFLNLISLALLVKYFDMNKICIILTIMYSAEERERIIELQQLLNHFSN